MTRRGEAGYLRMKREPWRKSGFPYWKGIYSASYPSGKMVSAAAPRPMLTCAVNRTRTGTTTTIAVKDTTAKLSVTMRISGVGLDSPDAAQALVNSFAVVLRREWITNAFQPVMTSIRILGVRPADIATRRLLANGDVLIDVLAQVLPGKSALAAQRCVSTSSAVTADLQALGEPAEHALLCHKHTHRPPIQWSLVPLCAGYPSVEIGVEAIMDAADEL